MEVVGGKRGLGRWNQSALSASTLFRGYLQPTGEPYWPCPIDLLWLMLGYPSFKIVPRGYLEYEYSIFLLADMIISVRMQPTIYLVHNHIHSISLSC